MNGASVAYRASGGCKGGSNDGRSKAPASERRLQDLATSTHRPSNLIVIIPSQTILYHINVVQYGILYHTILDYYGHGILHLQVGCIVATVAMACCPDRIL